MQSRRNWRRFGPVLVSDPHDEAELEAVPKLIRMAFIVGSVVPRGLSAPPAGGALGGGFAPTLLLVWRTRRGLPQSCSGLARLTRQGGFAHILVAVMEGIAVLQMK